MEIPGAVKIIIIIIIIIFPSDMREVVIAKYLLPLYYLSGHPRYVFNFFNFFINIPLKPTM